MLLFRLGQALIGAVIGGLVRLPTLTRLAADWPSVLLVIVACALLGPLLSAVTGVDRLTAYLATTPGGLFAVLAIATGSRSDVAYVLAIQVIRVFAMLLFALVLGRLLRGR